MCVIYFAIKYSGYPLLFHLCHTTSSFSKKNQFSIVLMCLVYEFVNCFWIWIESSTKQCTAFHPHDCIEISQVHMNLLWRRRWRRHRRLLRMCYWTILLLKRKTILCVRKRSSFTRMPVRCGLWANANEMRKIICEYSRILCDWQYIVYMYMRCAVRTIETDNTERQTTSSNNGSHFCSWYFDYFFSSFLALLYVYEWRNPHFFRLMR